MEQWHCFKCKEKMVEQDVDMAYMEVEAAVEGIKCPKCGVAYLTEETVTEKVAKAEELLESK
jgi:YgiT-type zinc finger domain-containing protein